MIGRRGSKPLNFTPFICCKDKTKANDMSSSIGKIFIIIRGTNYYLRKRSYLTLNYKEALLMQITFDNYKGVIQEYYLD